MQFRRECRLVTRAKYFGHSDKNNYMNDKDLFEAEISTRLPMRAIELAWCDQSFFQRD